MADANVSEQNSTFWDELCGTGLATFLGITDNSPASLKKFDDWYFDFYPYLFNHIPFDDLNGKNVLEIGLGYGTVAQRLAESGSNYTGLDIAEGPVEFVNHRLRQANLRGQATRGDILAPPSHLSNFDAIVAIGCLHHTGNLALAIRNCYQLLRPGGKLIFMVYYAYSYRRFRMAPQLTLGYFSKEMLGYRGVTGQSAATERAAYDANKQGEAAPHTDWISARSLRRLCVQFSKFTSKIENIDQEPPFSKSPRVELLSTRWPRYIGLDLYATAVK